jgi:hypothetical protein
MPSKKPTHRLSVREKNGEGRCIIGSGWLWPDGSVSIKLNPCVVLTSKDEVNIKLFPINRPEDECTTGTGGPSGPE